MPRPGQLDDRRRDIEESGLFEVVDVSQFDWETVYDTEGYIDLLSTFSGHIAMQERQRDRLYSEIRRHLAHRPDGQVRRHWGGVLHIACRLRWPRQPGVSRGTLAVADLRAFVAGSSESADWSDCTSTAMPATRGYRLKVAAIAAWSDGAEVCGVGSSVIDGSGLAATISTAGMLSGLTRRCDANTWSMSSPRPR